MSASRLSGLTKLEWLKVDETGVSEAGAKELKKTLPSLQVYR